jgi:hypothetical protein
MGKNDLGQSVDWLFGDFVGDWNRVARKMGRVESKLLKVESKIGKVESKSRKPESKS